MIDVHNLGVKYHDFEAVSNVSLQVTRGQSVTIVGESGSGKTSLLYALAGLIKPSSGEVIIAGSKLEGVREKTAVILQHYGLLPWKTVAENVGLPLKGKGIPKETIRVKVNEALEFVNLATFSSRFPSQLSGGQKQRVAIARAFVQNPDLMLLDEATSALDAVAQELVQASILKMLDDGNRSAVVVTHNIEESVVLGSIIHVMKEGKIIASITNPSFKRPKDAQFYVMCQEVRRLLNHE